MYVAKQIPIKSQPLRTNPHMHALRHTTHTQVSECIGMNRMTKIDTKNTRNNNNTITIPRTTRHYNNTPHLYKAKHTTRAPHGHSRLIDQNFARN